MAIPPALHPTQEFGQAARFAPLRRSRQAIRRGNLGWDSERGKAPTGLAKASLEGSAER